MIFNPVIIVAIVVQSWISKASRTAGAIVGFVITTGILLWGLAIYDQHGQIAFFGIPLSQPVFVILCIGCLPFLTHAGHLRDQRAVLLLGLDGYSWDGCIRDSNHLAVLVGNH